MCGIVGIHSATEKSWIEKMNQIQSHRGPDDEGIFEDSGENFSMAMRRLAIIDLQSGAQPISTLDKRFTIIFNGEIYNAPELRKDLERRGVKFQTDHSDTEVVLQLYALEGAESLQKLNGMFAFAIYDNEKKTLFAARDHAGIKPLYYTQKNGIFAFASELKSLLALPFVKREIDFQSLFHYMSLMYVPGENTIIKDIKRLKAGHCFLYDLKNKNLKIFKWWEPFRNRKKDIRYRIKEKSELVKLVRENFEAAVNRWTLADVSIACSLSGGLDSSAIVGALSKNGQKIKTYSLGFKEEGENYWDELPRAREVAKKWETDHHELILNPEDLLNDLVSMVWHLDEPYAGGLPSWEVFKFMSKDVKVGLTGTGGDEMFGNYGKWRGIEPNWLYKFFVQREKEEKISEKFFRENFFEKYYYFSDKEKLEFVFENAIFEQNLKNTSEFLFKFFEAGGRAGAKTLRDKICYMDLETQLPEEFLMMTDRFSMAHSLEARTPFLDKEFMEFMLAVPSNLRTKHFNLKYLLREAVRALLPSEIINARKKGFVIPIKLWLRGKLRPLVQFLLNPERLKHQGIFKPEFYTHFVLSHLDGKSDYTNKIWAAVMFQLWHFVFIEKKQIDKPSFTWKDIIS